MILYFSATGNSEYLAKKLSQLIDDEALDLFSYIKNKEQGKFFSKKPYVLVTPTYSWRVPRFLSEYLQESEFSGSDEVYLLMDYGDSCGNAEKYIKKDLYAMNLKFKGLYGIQMPENYLMLFDLASDEKNKNIISAADGELKKFAEFIKNKEELPSLKSNFIGRIESSLVNKLFFKFIVKDKKFYHTDACIKCGLCAKVCVLNNITYTDGYPKWNGNCTHCAACIAKCPVNAIEYGKKTIGKKRYLLSKLIKK